MDPSQDPDKTIIQPIADLPVPVAPGAPSPAGPGDAAGPADAASATGAAGSADAAGAPEVVRSAGARRATDATGLADAARASDRAGREDAARATDAMGPADPAHAFDAVAGQSRHHLETGQGALPTGTRLGEFLITEVLGSGAFGHVYLAQDYSLGRSVVLKEYMPTALAVRMDDGTVQPRTPRQGDAYAAGLISFIQEARQLARFEHPALVKLHRLWEARGTAYMVMPWIDGPSLRQALEAMQVPPSEAWLRSLLAPLLDALDTMHAQQCIHCGISPDRIRLQKDERPVLLDFGVTRQVVGEGRDAQTLLEPGYAPLESYARDAGVQPGPWTDLYALAAVVRFAILGQTPVPSVQRIVEDTLEPLVQAARGRYGEAFLQALDQAMELAPEKRPQSASEMRRLLRLDNPGEAAAEPAGAAVPARTVAAASPLASASAPAPAARRPALWIGGAVLVLALASAALLWSRQGSERALPVAQDRAPAPVGAPVPIASDAAAQTASGAAAAGLASAAAGTDQPANANVAPSGDTAVGAAPNRESAAAAAPGPSASGVSGAGGGVAAVPAQLQAASRAGSARAGGAESQSPADGRTAADAARGDGRAAAAAGKAAPARPAPAVKPPAATARRESSPRTAPSPAASTAAAQHATPVAPAPAPPIAAAVPAEPARAPARAVSSPADVCGKRMFLSACIRDRCTWAEFVNHPMCVALRAKQPQ